MSFRYWTGRWRHWLRSIPSFLHVCDGRAVARCQIRVDDAGLRMGSIYSTHCETAGWLHRRRAMRTIEIDGGIRRIDRPVQVAPAAFYSKARFRRPAISSRSASGAGTVIALTRGRNAAPIARPVLGLASRPHSSCSSSTFGEATVIKLATNDQRSWRKRLTSASAAGTELKTETDGSK
jgi:hypothetical protein